MNVEKGRGPGSLAPSRAEHLAVARLVGPASESSASGFARLVASSCRSIIRLAVFESATHSAGMSRARRSRKPAMPATSCLARSRSCRSWKCGRPGRSGVEDEPADGVVDPLQSARDFAQLVGHPTQSFADGGKRGAIGLAHGRILTYAAQRLRFNDQNNSTSPTSRLSSGLSGFSSIPPAAT